MRMGEYCIHEVVVIEQEASTTGTARIKRDKCIRRLPVLGLDQTLPGSLAISAVLDRFGEVSIDSIQLVDRQCRGEPASAPEAGRIQAC